MSYLVPLVAVFKLHFLALQVEPKIRKKSQNLVFFSRCCRFFSSDIIDTGLSDLPCCTKTLNCLKLLLIIYLPISYCSVNNEHFLKQKKTWLTGFYFKFIFLDRTASFSIIQMLGCGAHVRIIALPHVRCACGKVLEVCVRCRCDRVDRTFYPG